MEKSMADLVEEFKNLSAAIGADRRPHFLSDSATNASIALNVTRQSELLLEENLDLQKENRMLHASNARLHASETDIKARLRDLCVAADRSIQALQDDIVSKNDTIRELSLQVQHLEEVISELNTQHNDSHARLRQEMFRSVHEEYNQLFRSVLQTHALFRFTETGDDGDSSTSSKSTDETLVDVDNDEEDVLSDQLGQGDSQTRAENNHELEAQNNGVAFLRELERLAHLRMQLRNNSIPESV